MSLIGRENDDRPLDPERLTIVTLLRYLKKKGRAVRGLRVRRLRRSTAEAVRVVMPQWQRDAADDPKQRRPDISKANDLLS